MGRPKKHTRRDRQLNLSLTSEELDRIKARAEAAGMRAVAFGRAVLLNENRSAARQRTAGGTIERLWLRQLARLGNNLNQLVRRLHAVKEPPPPGLEALLRDIRQILEKGHADDP